MIKDAELELFIANNWNLLNVVIDKLLQENGGRKVFLLQTKQGKIIAKLFGSDVSVDKIRNYTDVLIFLEQANFKHSPKLKKLANGNSYTTYGTSYIYMYEYIDGKPLTECNENYYQLGQIVAKLHAINNYPVSSDLNIGKYIENMKPRFANYNFKQRYDEIICKLPDFSQARQCFIHTDICLKNAVRNKSGEIILIDFDDAGTGSVFIDLGYPLITGFVRFENKQDGQSPADSWKISFDHSSAKAFYKGYFSLNPITETEKQLVFAGAVFMQLMYMPCFGEEAVPYMWQILDFALENQAQLLKVLEK